MILQHPAIPNLRRAVRDLPTVEGKLTALRDAFPQTAMWLLSCGNTLNDFSTAELLDGFAAGDVVVCVKQAIEKVGPRCDFHLLNDVRLDRYSYGEDRPIVLAYQNVGRRAEFDADIELPANIENFAYKSSVSETGDFDRWRLHLTPERPYGPGIIYELGFYLALHLGVRTVFTLGYSSHPGKASHFYRNSGRSSSPELDYCMAKKPRWKAWLRSHGIAWFDITSRADAPRQPAHV